MAELELKLTDPRLTDTKRRILDRLKRADTLTAPEVAADFDLTDTAVRQHLEAFPRISSGDADAGPIALLSARERFHWLVSPRSTMIQVSPVHSGLCASPEEALEHLVERFVQNPD